MSAPGAAVRRLRALLPLLLPVLLVPLAAAQDVMDRPPMQVGDEWDFFVTGEHGGPDGPQAFAYVGKRLVAARETVDGEDAFRVVELTLDVPPTDDPEAWAGRTLEYGPGFGTTWVRVSDGALLKTARTRPTPDGMALDVTRHPGGCDVHGYPYSDGRAYEGSCRVVQQDGGERAFRPLARVAGNETVRVPAGEFRAWVVDAGADGQTGERQWYAPDACWRVRAEATPPRVLTMTLLGWKCGTGSGGERNAFASPPDLATLGTEVAEGSGTPWPSPVLFLLLAGAAARLRARQ